MHLRVCLPEYAKFTLAWGGGEAILVIMSTNRPVQAKLHELTAGQWADFFALLAEKIRGTTREGRPYYHCRFRDARRAVSFMAWCDDRWFEPAENEWQAGQVYKLRAVYLEHARYGPQIDLHNLRMLNEAELAEGIAPAQFVEMSRHDLVAMWKELRSYAEQIENGPLRTLTLSLLDQHAERLQRLPLTRDRVYTCQGGLLEHLVAVTRTAVDLTARYANTYPDLRPPLNRDVVIAGAILHELGKLLELDEDPLLPGPTIAGKMTGSLVLGRDLLRQGANEVADLDPELLQLVEHIVLTPLYSQDGGGPRWSLIPEGLLVQYADDLDMKLALYARCLERDMASGPFTERDPFLGRQLFKGRNA